MKIELDLPLDNGAVMPVEAEIVFDLAPHLASVGTFAAHKRPYYFYEWQVSNIETGCWIKSGKSKRKAIEASRKFLAKKTPADLLRAYAVAIKRHKLKGRI